MLPLPNGVKKEGEQNGRGTLLYTRGQRGGATLDACALALQTHVYMLDIIIEPHLWTKIIL